MSERAQHEAIDGGMGRERACDAGASQDTTFVMGIENVPQETIVGYLTDMYADPLAAAMRETVSNAFDALGERIPTPGQIEVRLDDDMTPGMTWFSVKDQGCGMDAEALVSVYAQYGVSTKAEDDTKIGAFGLGAKSPLAIADEMLVVSKASGGESLLLRAYKAADGRFLADMPRPFIGGEVTLEPFNASDAAGQAAYGDGAQGARGLGKPIRMEDPFADEESGTLVAFPITRWGDETDEGVNRARAIIRSMDDVSRGIYGVTIAPDEIEQGEAADESAGEGIPERGAEWFEAARGDADADGRAMERVMLSMEWWTLSDMRKVTKLLENDVAWARYEGRSGDSAHRIGIGDSTVEELARLCAFRVGSWLYPATGRAWAPGLESFPIVMEVPSRTLSFTPSRDSLIHDGGDGALGALVRDAAEMLVEAMSDSEMMCDIANWTIGRIEEKSPRKARYASWSFSDVIHALFGYGMPLSYDGGPEMAVGAYRIATDRLLGFAGHTLRELEDSLSLPVGALVKEEDGSVSDRGVLLAPMGAGSRLVGGAVDLTSEPVSGVISTETGRYTAADFEFAGQRTFLDLLTSDAIDAVVKGNTEWEDVLDGSWEPEGGGGSSTVRKRERKRPIGCAYRRTSMRNRLVDSRGADAKASPVFPLGLCAWREGIGRTRHPYMVIDASDQRPSRISHAIELIANKRNVLADGWTSQRAHYILIQPKDRGGGRYDDGEIERMISGIEAICGPAVIVSREELAQAMLEEGPEKVPAGDRKTLGELEKLLKDHYELTVSRKWEPVPEETIREDSPDRERIADASVEPKTISRFRYERGQQDALVNDLVKEAKKAGIVVCDSEKDDEPAIISDIVKAAIALEALPDRIERIIVVSPKKVTKAREAAARSCGIEFIYDISGKVKGDTLVARSDLAIVPFYDDKARNLVPTDVVDRITVAYRGEPTDEMVEWRAWRAWQEAKLVMQSEIADILPHSGTLFASGDVDVVDMVRALSFDGIDIGRGPKRPSISSLKMNAFSLIDPVEAQPDAGMAETMSMLRDVTRAWARVMGQYGIAFVGGMQSVDDMRDLGRVCGIDAIVSGVLRGIPLSDLTRGWKRG